MRAALSGLTAQGRSVIAAGIVVAVFSPLLGEKELFQVAIFLIAVPLLAVVATSRMRAPLFCRRSTTIRHVPAGRTSTVRLRVAALRHTRKTSRLEDRAPPEVGAMAFPSQPGEPRTGKGPTAAPHPDAEGLRFILEPLALSETAELEYQITPRQRGHYFLGPLTVALGDPFEMCSLPQAVSGVQQLIVTPPVTPLPVNALIDGRTDLGAHRGRQPGGHEDDATVRAYRHGDEPRKVHWRSTARTGNLMVRAQEHPQHATATVLLDTRAVAHVAPQRGGSSTDSSFEWAVAAAGSIVHYLSARGLLVTLITDDGDGITPGHPGEQLPPIMDFLAGVGNSSRSSLVGGFGEVDHRGLDSCVVVSILGALTEADARSLRRRVNGATGRPGVALGLLVDSASWTEASTLPIMVPRADLHSGNIRSIPGWHTVTARYGSDLAQLWRMLATAPAGSADWIGAG